MRIIPAIDIIGGQCVRLTKGDYEQKSVYHSDPLEVAKQFEDAGLQYLHLVDLDGAKAGKITNYKILEKIASNTKLKIDFGGGLKTNADIEIAFQSGASQVTGGSIAVKNPILFIKWLEKYGGEKIILGADVIDKKIATNAWQEQSQTDLLNFLKEYIAKGIQYSICTDVAKDGMLQGPSLDLYNEILSQVNIRLIASGGVTSLQDLEALKSIGCEGAIIGKAIYENKISLQALSEWNAKNN